MQTYGTSQKLQVNSIRFNTEQTIAGKASNLVTQLDHKSRHDE